MPQRPQQNPVQEAHSRKGQRKNHELFQLLVCTESDAFIADVTAQWASLADLARIAAAPVAAPDRRPILLAHAQSLCRWLTQRVRESVVSRFQLGRSANPAAFGTVFTWAADSIGTDLAMAILPGGAGWRYADGHPRAGERVGPTDRARLDEIEEIHYPLSQQDESFYGRLAQGWLEKACAHWPSAPSVRKPFSLLTRLPEPACEGVDHELCGTLHKELAGLLSSEIRTALGFAQDHIRNLVAAAKASAKKPTPEALGPKKQDHSRLFDSAGLTEKQRQCLSLKWEYELTVAEIAQRMGLHRTTVKEHLEAGNARLSRSSAVQKARRRQAIVKPEN